MSDDVASQAAAGGVSGERGTEQPGLRGPALWMAIGVVLGGSLVGIGLSYVRQAPLPAIERVVRANQASSSEDEAVSGEPAAGGGVVLGHRVNLNTALQAELELLPGVGATMSQRIIEYRSQRGGFTSVNELDRVKGIGPRMLERLRPLVRVD